MRARIGVGELLRAAIHDYEGMPTRAALQLALLVFARPRGEFDLEQGGGADCLDPLRTPDHQRLLTVFNAMSANLQLKGIQDGKGRLDPEPLRKVLARFQEQIARKRR